MSPASGRSLQLRPEVVAVADLPRVVRDRMFELMVQHYDNVCQRAFETDLDEKQWVVQIWHPDSELLCGFSTQMIVKARVGTRDVRALFSGDTIIDHRFWGQHALMRGWGSLAARLMDEGPTDDFFWFLLSQGYRTYRFLPLFFQEFHPRYEEAMPSHVQESLDAVAIKKYGGRFDSHAGIVRRTADQYFLKQSIGEISTTRLRDPHVRFFAERNPEHAAGDELCCIAPLTWSNFTTAGLRFVKRETQ